MELSRERIRFFWMGVLLILSFLALGYRLVDLQVVQHEPLKMRAEVRHRLEASPKGYRGDIRDVNGEPLARSLPARVVCADPSVVGPHAPVVARLLAPLLATNEPYVLSALLKQTITNQGVVKPRKYVPLKRRVPDQEWRAIRAAITNETFGLDPQVQGRLIGALRDAIFVDPRGDEVRVYPNGTLGSAVLGFTDVSGRGVEGLEAFLNESLAGVDGYIVGERSFNGRESRRSRAIYMPPQHGRHVYLTIDARLQMIAEQELEATVKEYQAKGGAVVMVNPRTGRVLAMASFPNYDPNLPPTEPDDALRRRNWAVSTTFEPGSTFKIVAATAVLNEGLMDLNTLIDCSRGHYERMFGRQRIRLTDVHAIKEGLAPLERVIAESSNIGTFQIALALGKERYAEYVRRFGFHERTGIRLPMEERGLLRPVSAWTMLDYSRIPMGYTVGVTPLQLTMALAAIANDGKLMRPQVIDRIVTQDGLVLSQPAPEVVRTVCTPETAAKVRQALQKVVDDGTGSKVRMDQYTVAGKTGTAEMIPYKSNRYYSSFIGFFPTTDPELCITVMIQDPNARLGYYGGKVAAPAFRRIAERAADYLGIRPDKSPEDEEAERPRTAAVASAATTPRR